jgi:hypothetical protein
MKVKMRMKMKEDEDEDGKRVVKRRRRDKITSHSKVDIIKTTRCTGYTQNHACPSKSKCHMCHFHSTL